MRDGGHSSSVVGHCLEDWNTPLKAFSMQSTARVLLLALAYLLAACGSAGTVAAPPTLGPIALDTPVARPTQPAHPTSAAAAPTNSIPPTATSQAGAANLLISYHKSGGFAGVDETLTVYDDGRIELRDKRGSTSSQAAPSDIQALQKLLTSPEFTALQLPVWPPGADQFVYELTVPGRAQPIVTVDGADNPPVLREVIGALEQLKTQAK
jgi:hypothetical protein